MGKGMWFHLRRGEVQSGLTLTSSKSGSVTDACAEPGCKCFTPEPKIAIVIQGPTGSGKTTVISHLRQACGQEVGSVLLDTGWNSGESRRDASSSSERYADLVSENSAIILIEQNYGEDAMCKPEEWTEILVRRGFFAFAFRLKPPIETINARNRSTGRVGIDESYHRYYGNSQTDPHALCIRAFSTKSGVTVHLLETNDDSVSQVASRITQQVRKCTRAT